MQKHELRLILKCQQNWFTNHIIWSVNSKKVIIAELTIRFEANIDWVYQGKLEKYEDLRKQCIKNTWSTDIYPLEIGCRGFISNATSTFLGCPRGVMVKAMNCGIVVREFVLQSRYYVHFRANTLGKGMNPLILPPAMGK